MKAKQVRVLLKKFVKMIFAAFFIIFGFFYAQISLLMAFVGNINIFIFSLILGILSLSVGLFLAIYRFKMRSKNGEETII